MAERMVNTILAPASILVLWSLFMLFWMAGTRLPAMRSAGIDARKSPPGGRGAEIDKLVAPSVAWKSHNYAHLMEQPTIFYATVSILTLAGHGTGINTMLAWGYVTLRIMHSLWQATVNRVPVRFVLFLLSTGCLLAMAINAVRITCMF